MSVDSDVDKMLDLIQHQSPIPPPANKLIVTQQSFFSTKKRKNKPTVRLCKPTADEKKSISEQLSSGNRLYKTRKHPYG
jgi:hypothetical protein